MFRKRILASYCAWFALSAILSARGGLTSDQLKMLQDPGGWEYIKIADLDNGIQTQHTCFDGHPHPERCSGTLTLSSGNTFVQQTRIHGQSVQRHGKYKLDGNQLTFFDELGTKDGPYTLDINTQTRRLVMQMPPLQIDLELEKQYRKDRQAQKQTQSSQ